MKLGEESGCGGTEEEYEEREQGVYTSVYEILNYQNKNSVKFAYEIIV